MAEFENEQERENALEILRNSYAMYEKSMEEVKKVRNSKKDKDGTPVYTDKNTEDTIQLMKTMQKDIVDKYVQLNGSEEGLVKNVKEKYPSNKKRILEAITKANEKDAMKAYIEKMSNGDGESRKAADVIENSVKDDKNASINTVQAFEEPKIKETFVEKYIDFEPQVKSIGDNSKINEKAIRSNMSYDVVSLPSNGQCYKSKKSTVMVSHLTAYDENMILSPNLYKNGTFLDQLLKNKVLDSDIDTDDLVQGDRDAIIIWLRAGGYGNEYAISAIDENTGQAFDTEIDLSTLNYRNFRLKGDENGYFDYIVPSTGDKIKFKFLTNGDSKRLLKLSEEENLQGRLLRARNMLSELRSMAGDEKIVKDNKYQIVIDKIDSLEDDLMTNFDEENADEFNHDLTNRLLLSTVSVNNITDRKFVVDYILHMPLKDASAYRKYILDNEPGIDYNIKIKRPDSLGGGYQDSFLRLDQFIFIEKV